jgi:hypothetical protein
MIAEDAGEAIVSQLLNLAGSMGFNYKNNLEDIKCIKKNGTRRS